MLFVVAEIFSSNVSYSIFIASNNDVVIVDSLSTYGCGSVRMFLDYCEQFIVVSCCLFDLTVDISV